VGVFEGVVVGIGIFGRDAEAGGPADRRLVELRPGALRLHEGLVVEAGRHEVGEQADERERVPLARRPGVLARRLQPLVEFDLPGAQVRRDAALAGVERNDRVGLLGPERQQTARPMQLERAADEMDAVGDQRRGEGVAGAAGVGSPVEGEAQRPGAIDAAAFGQPERAAHRRATGAAVSTR
jgi:hypothetical protein